MLQNIGNTGAAKDQAPCYVFSYFPSYFLRHASIPSLSLPPCSYMHRYKSHLHTESCNWEWSCNSQAFFNR